MYMQKGNEPVSLERWIKLVVHAIDSKTGLHTAKAHLSCRTSDMNQKVGGPKSAGPHEQFHITWTKVITGEEGA